MINNNLKVGTRNNLLPQDSSKIVKNNKIIDFLDKFIKDKANLAYIYGNKLTGKTKATTIYIDELIEKNIYQNIIWIDIKNNKPQKEQIIDAVLLFILENKEKIDEEIKQNLVKEFIEENNNLMVLDFNEYEIEEEMLKFIKTIVSKNKMIIISCQNVKTYENELPKNLKSFENKEFINIEDFKKAIYETLEFHIMTENNEEFINNIYNLTKESPFVMTHILKEIIEKNKYGESLEKALEEYEKIRKKGYDKLLEKIVHEKFNSLSNLSKKILIIVSCFKFSVSIELVNYICEKDITSNEWKNALKECYDKALLTPIILNTPRINTNNFIKMIVLEEINNVNFSEKKFSQKIGKYYLEKTRDIGECYNELSKLKKLDIPDEWDIILESLNYLYNNNRHLEYVRIIRQLKYYIYVRGIWQTGEKSLHLKRAKISKIICDIDEEVEAYCDYIDVMSKSQNKEEAEKYLVLVEEIIENQNYNINKRILCLYNHVKALYVFCCLKDYKTAYEIWQYNEEKYFKYIDSYRKYVNQLWLARCYLNIEKDIEKICSLFRTRIEEMRNVGFLRAELDYELLLIALLFNKYAAKKNKSIFEEIENRLDECENILKTKFSKDLKNEATYFKLRCMEYSYKKDKTKLEEYYQNALKNYEMMNSKKDIKDLKKFIKL